MAFDNGFVSSFIAILIRRDDEAERSCCGCSRADFLRNSSCVVLRNDGVGGDV
jgi:hypothetical protein